MAGVGGIPDRLKKLCEACGSQAALARLGEISEGTLINWLRGAGFHDSSMRQFAHNLGVPAAWLVEGISAGSDESEISKVRLNRTVAEAGGARGALAKALAARRMNTSQLARLIRYDAGVIAHVLRGGRASEKMIEAIVREIPELTKEQLMAGSDEPMILSESGTEGTFGAKPTINLPAGMTGRLVPLLSMAQAGTWDAGHSDEGWTGQSVFALNVDDNRGFAIRVTGNSMEPDLREGDVVICSPRAEVAQGACAVVRTKSEQAFIKFWRKRGNTAILESANAAYPPISFPLAEIAGAWPVIQRIASGMIKKQMP